MYTRFIGREYTTNELEEDRHSVVFPYMVMCFECLHRKQQEGVFLKPTNIDI